MKARSIITFLLKVSLTIGIFYYLIKTGRLDLFKIVDYLKNPTYAFSLIGVMIVADIIGILRWHLLVVAQGIHQRLKDSALLTMIGLFFNTTLPGAVSGDLIKFLYMSRLHPGITKTKGFISMLVDRIMGLAGLFILAGIGVIFLDSGNLLIQSLAHFVEIGLIFILLFFVFVLSPFQRLKLTFRSFLAKLPLSGTILKIYDAMLMYKEKPLTFLATLLVSIVIHTIFVTAYYFVALSMGLNTTFGKLLLVVPIGMITTAIPIAPAGIGVGHVVFEKLLSAYGVSRGADLFNILILFQILVNLTGGIFYLIYKPGNQKITILEEPSVK